MSPAEEGDEEVDENARTILELRGYLAAAQASRDNYAVQLAQIRGAMSTVAVYEGLVDASSVVMMVADLARDHEELEARIDAALLFIGPDRDGDWLKIVAILKGGERFDSADLDGSG